jgi:ankyrin repeat protein
MMARPAKNADRAQCLANRLNAGSQFRSDAVVTRGLRMVRLVLLCIAALLLGATAARAATAEVADAAMRGDRDAVRAALARRADVNLPQVDGTTALHWAVERDDLDMADALIRAGARVTARTREGVLPLQLAAINGSAPMIDRLLKAGAEPDAPLTPAGDTAVMMAARTGARAALRLLLEAGANVNAKETWGGTTALMWAVSEGHLDAAKLLLGAGADVNARSNYVAPANGRGFEGRTPVGNRADPKVEEFASGWLTPLMLAAREGHVDLGRALLDAGAEVNAAAGDGKTALSLAIFNGNYDMASLLVDRKADVNKADAQRFTPLFWAADRRNMETAPNFPWMVTVDPLPLIRRLLDAGANPNAMVNNTPRARMREGSPRIVFATALMRAAFAADQELVKLLLDRGADPAIVSRDGETMVSAAAGLAFIHGYHRGKTPAERLQVVKLFVGLGNDVNQADDYGITPLMAAANGGDVALIQYLIDVGADLGAHDLGKKNDGQFGSSVEPLMPIDYAIGVGTFVPNNAVIIHEDAVALMAKLMKERGITHTTSECTLRGFTCAQAKVDPKVATPAEIMRARKAAIGHQIEGVTGGLEAK